MLELSDSGRQYVGDYRIGEHREAVVDGRGGRRVLPIIDRTQRKNEGKAAELVVEQNAAEVARGDDAKEQGSN